MINTNSYLCKNDEQEEERPCLLEMPVCNNSSRFFRAVCLRNVQMSREQRKANEIDCDARVNNFQYKQQNDIKLTLIITWHQPITLPRTSNHWNQSLLSPEISNKSEWKNCTHRERERERERERLTDSVDQLFILINLTLHWYHGLQFSTCYHNTTKQLFRANYWSLVTVQIHYWFIEDHFHYWICTLLSTLLHRQRKLKLTQ